MPSKLEQMQLQFRQRLKEERMIKIHTDSQQKALSKVQKYDAVHTSTVQSTVTVPKPQPAIVPPQSHHSPIKKGSPGVDRSRPLPPISKEPRNTSSSRSSPTENGTKISMISNSRSRSVDLEQRYASSRALQNGSVKMPPNNDLSYSINLYSEPECQLETSPPRIGLSKPVHVDPQPVCQSDASPPRNGLSKPVHVDPQPVCQPEASPPRNGLSKPVNLDTKPLCQPETSPPRNGLNKPANPEHKTSYQRATTPEKKLNQDAKSRLKQAELQRLKANTKAREESSSRNGFTGAISKSSTDSSTRRTTRPSNSVTAAPSRARPRAQPAASTPMRKPAASPSKANSRAAPSANASKDSAPRKPPGPGQEQCTVCGRNFNQDRIEKHRSICKKVSTKKVKVFDATKMRVKGTEAEQFVKKGLPKSDPKPAKKSDWRKKHNEFIEAIRQAKVVQQHLAKGGKVSDLPPPPPSDTSDYVPCPHCGRKFNEAVAERHIPKCKNISCNKKNPVPTRRR
ncbi:Zinc finger C2HC domain-containing protein 1C [Araneus ventricosus]|uniref:Zinc finger C2HC domain-containing protein 1C n=1 Tax=Araneus ventricosus TaxID=182803 RepID=A0A4Y2C0L6_ARAVE|nr:Zinc finger C2HC domain-containing protein 1C [Araneus ventricosus]